MTLQELQALYDEEKKKNEFKTRRIRQLEKLMIEQGIQLPKDLFGAAQGEDAIEEYKEELKEESDISQQLLK